MRANLPSQTQSALWQAVNTWALRNVRNSRKLKAAPALKILLLPAIACAFFAAQPLLQAQTPAAQTPAPDSTAPQKPVHHHKRPSPAHPLVAPMPAAPVTPPVPETPKWPAFDKPAEASVVWDSHGLSIDAQNSSLEQILKDVSAATGTKVEGITADQRVFGDYGPGKARDVLSQLLQGSGYNVLMVGDQGQGTPRQILLSLRQAASSQPAATPNQPAGDEDDVEEQPTPQEPIMRPGFAPGGAPRTPQQILQEREREMQPQQPPVNPQ
jgi:hypothetical protein